MRRRTRIFFAVQEKMGYELFEHLLLMAESDDKKSIKTTKTYLLFQKPLAAN